MLIQKPQQIVLADNYIPFRNELKRFLVEEAGLEVVGEANDGPELLDLLNRLTPDLIILDLMMLSSAGIGAVHQISINYPDVKLLILTMHQDNQLFRQAILAGAKGYLTKDDLDELIPAIEVIGNGGVYIPRFI